MPPVLSKEEKREKKKIAERIRMENIRKDPEKYALWRVKMQESYLKRKREGKILSVSNLTPREQKNQRKKSRESSKKSYYKKKLKEQTEKEIADVVSNENIIMSDPFSLTPKREEEISSPSRPIKSPSPPTPASVPIRSHWVRSPKNYKSVSRKSRVLSTNATVFNLSRSSTMCSSITPEPDSAISLQLRSPISPKPDSKRFLQVYSPTSSISDSPRSLSPQSNTAITGIPIHIENPKCVQTAQQKISAKKKSPWKHLLRKYKYRYHAELRIKDQQIRDLKRMNENYKKLLQRWRRFRKFKNAHNQHEQKIQEIDVSENKKLHFESICSKAKEDIIIFLEEDENSRICPGKNEFVSKGKIKKQKRYLTDSLKNLHKKYIATSQYKISYSSFCKLRPFWIRIPTVNIRDTCLCKVHENMELVVTALRKN
ncbi:PH domain-containing protein DDB_G0287875 [Bombyx mori]|uniref:Uncharacterized protein n=1 Tax=Bombyx mori TaxID=7091 RepID=A0A8R1WLH7_BOMMO|nr:PH domain-containing protein DDB_G0287875 [Bombyx mori]XP_037876513.1 PH domain-containing protein DDB_G0287875 [Bombyx mori]